MTVKYFCDRCGEEIIQTGRGFPPSEFDDVFDEIRGIKIPLLCVSCKTKLQLLIKDFVRNKDK